MPATRCGPPCGTASRSRRSPSATLRSGPATRSSRLREARSTSSACGRRERERCGSRETRAPEIPKRCRPTACSRARASHRTRPPPLAAPRGGSCSTSARHCASAPTPRRTPPRPCARNTRRRRRSTRVARRGTSPRPSSIACASAFRRARGSSSRGAAPERSASRWSARGGSWRGSTSRRPWSPRPAPRGREGARAWRSSRRICGSTSNPRAPWERSCSRTTSTASFPIRCVACACSPRCAGGSGREGWCSSPRGRCNRGTAGLS
jgi:hypothetical protein